MRKPLLLATVLSALALTLSACDVSATPSAARVGGTTISVDRLNSVLQVVHGDGSLRCIFGGRGVDYTGAGDGNFDASFTAGSLSELVQLQLEDDLITKLGLDRNAYGTTTANALLAAIFSPANNGSCVPISTGEEPAQAATSFIHSIPSSYRNVIEREQLDDVVLDAHADGVPLTAAGLAAYAQANRSELRTACVSLIVVSTKQDAQTLGSEIRRGANFASIARADSTDASSAAQGGAIGCFFPDELQAPIGSTVAQLATGALSAPVPFKGSWLLLQVTSRQADGTAAQIEQLATEVIYSSPNPSQQSLVSGLNAPAQSLVSGYAARVGVEVNPTYGSVAAGNSGGLVAAPIGPADSFLINSAAVSPASGG